MVLMSLRKSLIRLREFIISGVDTHLILDQVNALLSGFKPFTFSKGLLCKNKQLLNELKKAHTKVKSLQEQLTSLKETQNNRKIDFDMFGIKIKNLEREVEKLRQQEEKLEKPQRKKPKKGLREVQVQCDTFSKDYVQDLIMIARKARTQCEELNQKVQELQQKTLNPFDAISTATSSSTCSESQENDIGITGHKSLPTFELFQCGFVQAAQAQTDGLPSAAGVKEPNNIVSWLQAKAGQLMSVFKSQ